MSSRRLDQLALRRELLVARSALQRETLRIRVKQLSAPVQQASGVWLRLRPLGVPLLVMLGAALRVSRLKRPRALAPPRPSSWWRVLGWVASGWQAYRGLMSLRRR